MRATVLILTLAVVAFMLGITVGDHVHASDYNSGWDAGYIARADVTRENDAKLVAAGVCFYADLACPKKGKK